MSFHVRRLLLGVLMGAVSGLVVAVGVALLFSSGPEPEAAAPTPLLLAAGAVAGVLSARWILQGADTLAAVLARGFRLGVFEWLAVLGAGAFYSLRTAPDLATGAQNGVVVAGFALLMAGACALAAALARTLDAQGRKRLTVR